jgi:sulfur-oxidizing protein SoxY
MYLSLLGGDIMNRLDGKDRLEGLPSRRLVLTAASVAAVAATMAPYLAHATPATVEAELRKLLGERKPLDGKIKLDLPAIAENGLVVPLNFDVESPMTEADHVKAVHFFADGNPLPMVASFRFTPAAGKASASSRIRLAATQNIICVAEMSDGKVYMARQEVKVTIGGCGG